jgi:hypothetical protein
VNFALSKKILLFFSWLTLKINNLPLTLIILMKSIFGDSGDDIDPHSPFARYNNQKLPQNDT